MHVVEAARRRRRRRPAQCAVVILAAWLPLGDKGTALSGAVAIDRIDRLLFVFNYISSGYHIYTSLSSADRIGTVVRPCFRLCLHRSTLSSRSPPGTMY